MLGLDQVKLNADHESREHLGNLPTVSNYNRRRVRRENFVERQQSPIEQQHYYKYHRSTLIHTVGRIKKLAMFVFLTVKNGATCDKIRATLFKSLRSSDSSERQVLEVNLLIIQRSR